MNLDNGVMRLTKGRDVTCILFVFNIFVYSNFFLLAKEFMPQLNNI